MIFAAEGPSAAGKSRYVRSLGLPGIVGELAGHLRPDDAASLEEQSRFWVRHNEDRWAQALGGEGEHGLAVCDTDPLKLHYAWTLARAGVDTTADAFSHQLTLVRDSLRRQALGIADLIACVVPPESVLRIRRLGDTTRARRNFETHVRLATQRPVDFTGQKVVVLGMSGMGHAAARHILDARGTAVIAGRT